MVIALAERRDSNQHSMRGDVCLFLFCLLVGGADRLLAGLVNSRRLINSVGPFQMLSGIHPMVHRISFGLGPLRLTKLINPLGHSPNTPKRR